MGQLIKKTICVTLILVIGLLLIASCIVTIFFPKVCSSFFYSVGNEKACVFFAEYNYDKNQNIENLDYLLYKVKWAEDNQAIIEYSEIMINESGFSIYVEKIDSENEDSEYIIASYYDFIYTDYVIALYFEDYLDKAKLVAVSDVNNNKYSVGNAYSNLMLVAYLNEDYDFLLTLTDGLSALLFNLDGEHLTRAESDLEKFILENN